MTIMTLEQLCNDYDWAHVFADDGCDMTNVSKDIESVDSAPTTTFSRKDVREVLASKDGERDVSDWTGVFKLNDGRFLYAHGGCDYTGWD